MNAGANYHRRGGMTLVIAVLTIAVVSLAVLAMATRYATEAKMTRYALQDAQLRQLLLAGAAAAQQQLNRPPGPAPEPTPDDRPLAVALPAEIDGDSPSLVLRFATVAADGTRSVLVQAAVDGRHARQTLRFERHDANWRMVEAELE